MEPTSTLAERLTATLTAFERDAAGRWSWGWFRSPSALVREALEVMFMALLRCALALLDRAANPVCVPTVTHPSVPADVGADGAGASGQHAGFGAPGGHEDAATGGDGGTARDGGDTGRVSRAARAGRTDTDLAVTPGEERAPRSRASWDEPGAATVLAVRRIATLDASWARLPAARIPPGVEKTRMAGLHSHVLFVAK